MRSKRTAVIALAVIVLVAGCSSKPDDTFLANSIKASLFSDPALKSEPIQVTVVNGEATLVGDLSSEEARQRALSLTQGVPGILKINDSMHVVPPLAAVLPSPVEPEVVLAPVTPKKPVSTTPAPQKPATVKPSAVPNTAGVASQGTAPALPPSASEAVPVHPASAPVPPPKPAPPQPRKVLVPSGTTIHVVTIDEINSDEAQIGNTFQAALSAPIIVGTEVIVPERTNVSLTLMDANSAGKLKGKSEISVALDSMEFQGERYRLQSSTHDMEGKSQGKQTAKKVGIGAALGTAVGAIAGGGKGAAIGAAAGAGGGLATQALGKGGKLQIPSETKLDFTLTEPIEILLHPGK